MNELIKLEEESWQTLSSKEAGAAQKFYNSLLTDDAVMVFPGGMLIEGKAKILESFAAQPWKSFRFEGQHVVKLSENVGAVVYKVTAQRGGNDPYTALISSVYTRDGDRWKLALHQQTPL